MIFSADVEHLYEAISFVKTQLDKTNCGEKEKKQLSMAVEEIFINIASYAYPPENGNGKIWLLTETGLNTITITFRDMGVPYNPLENADPDLSMEVEDRQHGDFGIFMVKSMMDEITYERHNDKNVLSIRKSWND